MIKKLITYLFVIHFSVQYCRLIQETDRVALRETKNKIEQTPKKYEKPEDPNENVCEDFIGKDVCCTPAARTLMRDNFFKLMLIDNCQNSLNNLKRFWCHLHCDPNQHKYITKVEYIDYPVREKIINAITISYDIQRIDACGIFKSNQKISLFQTLESTKSLIGFFKFFGDQGVYQVPDDEDNHSFEFVGKFNIKEKGLEVPVVNCGQDYEEGQTVDLYGYPIDPAQSCGCDICQEKCKNQDWSKIIKDPSILDGFNILSLLWLGLLLLISFFGAILKFLFARNEEKDRAKSIDSYDRIKEDLN